MGFEVLKDNTFLRKPTVDTSAERSNGDDRLKVEPFGLHPVKSHSVAPLGFNNREDRDNRKKRNNGLTSMRR
ncbi:hypothetical protein CDAR_600421 [Caerostris darwini]|uniref:Uncharacterized protein n=1 Tax=Caerostris darwini TaxID=1538125 RepID=A0AAV4TV05_9ARAC|nr:hypothetical protein CDAR_600421 [Caerostris darwini]